MSLKDRLAAGDRLLGVLLRIPAEELVEMCAVAGFDFVLIDCEHGPADLVPLRQHLAVTAAYAVPTLVRVGSAEPALALRALDAGAAGIVAPHIDTPAPGRARWSTRCTIHRWAIAASRPTPAPAATARSTRGRTRSGWSPRPW